MSRVLATDGDHADAIVRGCRGCRGRRGRARLRPDVPASSRREDPHGLERAGEDPRRSVDGLHARCGACLHAIAGDPDTAWNLTTKRNTVAVVTDGSAVLGLGNIGPLAAMPVMEGKALLFKEFGGVDAWPICLSTTDTDGIVAAVEAIAPGFGGINLEDISAPRCFEIERGYGRRSTSLCSTTTSTAPPSSCSPRCSTRCVSSTRKWRT